MRWRELERRLSGRPPEDTYGDAPVSRRKHRVESLEVCPPAGPVTP